MRKAVVDVGSNSVLLAIEERTETGWRSISDESQVTALGEGVKQTGLLGEKGMSATLGALSRFFAQAGGADCVAYGTMALRLAQNTPDFQRRASAQGTPVTVLSGENEAQLGFESVAYDPTFADQNRISIIDVGGQSTELTTAHRVGDSWEVTFRQSFPIGTLALRGGLLSSETPGPGDLLAASAEIDSAIGIDYLKDQAGLVVVLGAAGTNLISIREKLVVWDPQRVHGQVLTFEEISRFVSSLSALGDAGRAAVIGMEPGRQRTIHLGALILERVMNAIGAIETTVSVRGWRHALLERGLPKG